MKKTFKKAIAGLIAVASLSVCMVGMSVNAATVSDSNSIFEWNRNGSSVYVALTNTSGTTRYAQVNCYGYDSAGGYVGHIGNEAVLADGEKVSKSGNITASSYVYQGYLYASGTPHGTPTKVWTKSN